MIYVVVSKKSRLFINQELLMQRHAICWSEYKLCFENTTCLIVETIPSSQILSTLMRRSGIKWHEGMWRHKCNNFSTFFIFFLNYFFSFFLKCCGRKQILHSLTETNQRVTFNVSYKTFVGITLILTKYMYYRRE